MDRSKKRLKIWLIKNGYNPDKFSIPENCPYTYEEAFSRDVS
ncbi:MAG: hypothetical protein N2Z81_01395 [Hydrogenothermaceae bacterium]|nr:hypothetical protein [Hydrogenothermaceae bacterium]